MKKILITSTDLMMVQFLIPHVLYLREQGYEVNVACSVVGNRIDEVRDKLGIESVRIVNLVRSPFNIRNFKGLFDLKKIIKKGNYNLIWTNEPVMGIMTRIAAIKERKNGTKVLYMTHGYHFYKGCSLFLKMFYPIEKFSSRLCDAIVTVNYEDYEITKNFFYTKHVYHIDGIGVDISKYNLIVDRNKKRKELDIPHNSFVVLSVGELKSHKNHEAMIRTIVEIKDKKIFYIICGEGELRNYLEQLSKKLGIDNQVKFLGYRKDIAEIMGCSDVFAFPSLREGLGIASIEAMASGLPIIGADTRGIRDYVINDKTGYLCSPNNVDDYTKAIIKLQNKKERDRLSNNCKKINKYDIKIIRNEIESIIKEVISK